MAPPKKRPEDRHDRAFRIPMTERQRKLIKRAARKVRAKHHLACAREVLLEWAARVLEE